MSIREDALAGNRTELLEICAKNELLDIDTLMSGVAQGVIAVPKNIHHNFEKIVAIGKGTSTKVNANIGASRDLSGVGEEQDKLKVAVDAGADTVMDLSTGGDITAIKKKYSISASDEASLKNG